MAGRLSFKERVVICVLKEDKDREDDGSDRRGDVDRAEEGWTVDRAEDEVQDGNHLAEAAEKVRTVVEEATHTEDWEAEAKNERRDDHQYDCEFKEALLDWAHDFERVPVFGFLSQRVLNRGLAGSRLRCILAVRGALAQFV